MTNRFTRARSICGSCSGKSGTLSANGGDAEVGGPDAVVPGWARIMPRPQRTPAAAIPLLIRNFLRVKGVFMNATLGRAHQIYFSNIAIFLEAESSAFPPGPRRHTAVLVKQRAKRAQAGEPAFQTNRGHRDSRFFQQKSRSFQSALVQIVMRRLMKRRLEHSQQMERRQTRRCGDIRQ